VVGVEGAAGDLVEGPAIRNFDLMSVEVVLCFNVTEDEGVGKDVRLAQRVDLVQRFVEDLQLLPAHLHDAPHENGAVLQRQLREGIVEVLPKRGVDFRGEAGIIDSLLLVDDGVGLVLPPPPIPVAAAILVGLPLLLLRVADPH
jgi:hypothetical protein